MALLSHTSESTTTRMETLLRVRLLSRDTLQAEARLGPLSGLRAIELVGLGPGPFAGMLLADMGAEVLRVDPVEAARAADTSRPSGNPMNRGKTWIPLDLKHPAGVDTLLPAVGQADHVIGPCR